MISGHQKKFEYLKRLADSEKLPHALLVSGVSSIEFISRIFGEDIIKKVHPDFFFVTPINKEILISQIRECIWRLSLKPATAPLKVALIDQAHYLNHEAQSALLKTLEEPKGKALLILITEYPNMLLPTILSRVQKIKFYPLFTNKKGGSWRNEKLIPEIAKLTKADLATRFQYVEKISKIPELKDILNSWLCYFREKLLLALNNPYRDRILVKRLTAILQKLQNTSYLISTTNVNPKLALEVLMLEL